MRSRTRQSRTGFTLIELIASMGVVSVVFGALGALVLLGIRAMPAGGEPSTDAAALMNAIEQLESDLATATEITLAASDRFTFTLADRDRDASDEKIAIQWPGSGNPLQRTLNTNAAQNVTPPIDNLGFSYIKDASGRVTAINIDLRLSSLGILRDTIIIDGGVPAP